MTNAQHYWDSKFTQGLPSLTSPDPFFVLAYQNFVNRDLFEVMKAGLEFPPALVLRGLRDGLGRRLRRLSNQHSGRVELYHHTPPLLNGAIHYSRLSLRRTDALSANGD